MSIQRKTVVVPGLGGAVLLGKTNEQTATKSTVAVPSIILPPGVRLEPEVAGQQTVPTAQPGHPVVSNKPPVVAAPVAQPTVASVQKGTPLPPPVPIAPIKTNGKGRPKGSGKPTVAELEAMLATLKAEAGKEEAQPAQAAQPTGTVANGQEGTKEEAKTEPFDWSKIDLSKPYARQKAMLALCNSLMGRRWDRQYKSTSTPEYYWTLKGGAADQRHAMNAIRTVAETLAALDPSLTVGPLDTTGLIGMGIEAAHNGEPTLTFAY